jgi:tetratricopeptide (TPR) repeat protein
MGDAGAATLPSQNLAARRALQVREQMGTGTWLLVVDDIDAAPPWFLDTLAFLLRESAAHPARGCLVCVAGRERAGEIVCDALEAGGFEPSPQLDLQPWPQPRIEEATEALLGARQLHPDLLHSVVSVTGGVPAEIESACRQLVDKKLLRLTSDGALTLAASASPADMVAPRNERLAAQLARCTPKQRELLNLLAVLRAPAAGSLIAAMNPDLVEELPALQRAGLLNRIVARGRACFVPAHAGIRAHILGTLTPADRRGFHDRIAAALEAEPGLAPDEVAALHRARGGSLVLARAAVTDLAVGTADGARFELLHEALVSLLQIWPEESEPEARTACEIQLLDVLLRLGAYDEVQDRTAAALRRPRAPEDAQRWRNRAVAAHLARGESLAALGLLDASPARDESPETVVLRARALSLRAQHREVLALCEPLADRLEHEDPAWIAAMELAAASRWSLGEVAEASTLLQTAIRWAEEHSAWGPLASQLSLMGMIEFYQGHMPDAERLSHRAHDLALRQKDRFGTARTLNTMAGVAGESGRYREAREYLRQALDVSRALGESESAVYVLGNLARLATTLARYAEALANIDASLALSRRRGIQNTSRSGLVERGEILAALGDDAGCRQLLAPVLEEGRGTLEEAHILITWSSLAIENGNLAAAEAWVARARAVFESLGAEDELVTATLLESRLHAARGEHERAVQEARATARQARELRFHGPRVDAETWLAELLLESDPVAAEALAREAATAAGMDLLEARWRAERVLGLAALARDNRPLAMDHYASCLRVLEQITSDLPPELADSYLATPARQRLLDEIDRLRAPNPLA